MKKDMLYILIGLLVVCIFVGGSITLVAGTLRNSGEYPEDSEISEEITESVSYLQKTLEFELLTEEESSMPETELASSEDPSPEPELETEPETLPEPAVVETHCVATSMISYSYSIQGITFSPEIASYLYAKLAENGIEWFMPYAVAIAFQESGFNPLAENKNGLDKGLFQYRITYWTSGDIFNPYTQVDVFVSQMANRAKLGIPVQEMISRHNVSDYGAYNPVYVQQVMQWVKFVR